MPPLSLTLTIIACQGETLAHGASAAFDAAGGTIGRDAGNTLMLPDDDGMVARRHAAVRTLADSWQLLNTSEHAAIALNGKMLAPGMQAGLSAGDIVNIGAYVLQAAASAAAPLPDSPTHVRPTDEACAFGSAFGSALGSALGPSPGPSFDAAGPDRLHNPLQTATLPAGHCADPLSGVAPSTGLGDLLDTPLDPLALFGAPGRTASGSGWNEPGWNEQALMGLFADLVATPTHGGFETPRPDSMPGHAIRDDVAEFDGHLRLKIALPSDLVQTRAEITVPDYSAKLHTKIAPRKEDPVKLQEPFTPVVDRVTPPVPLHEPSEPHTLLVRAFLEGVGVTPDATADIGLTPELMHTLGTLIRALRQQVT